MSCNHRNSHPSEKNILLDVMCLDEGIPPLSQDVNSAIDMICKLPSAERRRVNRKIRKLCKKAIRHHASSAFMLSSRLDRIERDEASCGLKTKRNTFSRSILARRLFHIKTFMLHQTS